MISLVETAKNHGDLSRSALLGHEGNAYSAREAGYANPWRAQADRSAGVSAPLRVSQLASTTSLR